MFKRRESKLQSAPRRQVGVPATRRRRLLLEGLEQRQLMAAGITPTIPNVTVPAFTGPRNVGTVQAFAATESERTDQIGRNDFFQNADFLPLGTAPGKQATIDVTGSLPFISNNTFPPTFSTDLDTFAFDLRAGDILDISTLGAAGTIDLRFADGRQWLSTDTNQAFFYPRDSPLMTTGNAVISQVVPRDGRYYLTISPILTGGNYTLGLRVYRPVVEQLPIGTQQVLFVDFDGAIYPRTVFDSSGLPVPGVIRLPSLQESLPLLGIEEEDEAALNQIIDLTMIEVEKQFQTLVTNGSNGDYDATGIPGQYGILVLNSRDHADPGSNPLVTRMIVGGTVDDAEIDTIGISSTLDVGNFSMDDIVIGLLDSVVDGVDSVPRAPTRSLIDAISDFLALLITHEAGHSFGSRHTLNTNNVPNIMDSGGRFDQAIGAGLDGIYGTIDDQQVAFRTDRFAPEGIIGTNFVADGLSLTLATGRVGGAISGRVFNDANRNGSGTGDSGIAGVTVFGDRNGNGVLDAGEPSAITAADGTYSLAAAAGSLTIVVVPPASSAPTTPTSRTATVTGTGTSTGVDFGFANTSTAFTGRVFADNNSSGTPDAGEGGVPGVYVYLDLDGDNRPDLGEPSALTGADGTYRLNFPGTGPFTIRTVVPAGFELTSPNTAPNLGEWNNVRTTDAMMGLYDFGFLPSRDYGDAPARYAEASHAILTGLSLGATVDRDLASQPSANATGDDTDAQGDDEDGVVQLTQLGLGGPATFQVTTNNSTGGDAYLSAWFDFNQDGVFDNSPGSVERVVTSRLLATGSTPIQINVPATARTGEVIARFRYSQTQNLGPAGDADSGEVEDYQFVIQQSSNVINDDNVTVPLNTPTVLDILSNDFDLDGTLRINSLSNPSQGTVRPSADGRSVIYTPQAGTIGLDSFRYTVRNQFGVVVDDNGVPVEGVVRVTISFRTEVPIALDDVFEVPQGSSNRPLNVLDNDVPSLSGGLSISSVSTGSAGGTIRIVGGGQSLSYTPALGFTGTEQFTYSVIDGNGVSSPNPATVTINMLPGSLADDRVAFTFQTLSALGAEVSTVQVGDIFRLKVFVQDLPIDALAGVASAFLDVLYTDSLVSPVDSNPGDNRPYDVTFGPRFTGFGNLQQPGTLTPGLLDELGGVQPIGNATPSDVPIELLTVTMRATAAGVALFQADPADLRTSETVLIGSDVALTPSQQRLGRTELVIQPRSNNFTSAIDDSFPEGRDSNGNLITSTSLAVLDVLQNDLIRRAESGTTPPVLGAPLAITEFGFIQNPTLGVASINNNGTPNDRSDDFINYTANIGTSGIETFSYFIVTADGTRTSAQVTLAVGNIDNYLVGVSFELVDERGNLIPNNQVTSGQRFGVKINVDDLRSEFESTIVAAAFLDLLYDRNAVTVADTSSTDRYNFDVTFGQFFDAGSGVGSAARPGIIDEFGTQDSRTSIPSTQFEGFDPRTLGTIFFVAGQPTVTQFIGSPADASPFQDTLLVDRDDPVPRSRIRFDVLEVTIVGGGGNAPVQNFALPADVNADGVVTPIDALVIINEINRQASLALEGETAGTTSLTPSFFTDVNGDGKVTASDALTVINYLNVQAVNRLFLESEQNVAQPDSSQDHQASSTDSTDAAVTLLSSEADEKAANFASPVGTPVANAAPATGNANDDEEEEDVLGLLAEDIASVWL